MDTASEASDRDPQPPISVTSAGSPIGGSPPGLQHSRALSESSGVPIRSLTTLALSATSPQCQQRLSPGPLSRQSQPSFSPTSISDQVTLQQILARVDDVHRHCASLVQIQTQQGEQLRLIEAAVLQHGIITRAPMTQAAPQSLSVALRRASASLRPGSPGDGSSNPRTGGAPDAMHSPYHAQPVQDAADSTEPGGATRGRLTRHQSHSDLAPISPSQGYHLDRPPHHNPPHAATSSLSRHHSMHLHQGQAVPYGSSRAQSPHEGVRARQGSVHRPQKMTGPPPGWLSRPPVPSAPSGTGERATRVQHAAPGSSSQARHGLAPSAFGYPAPGGGVGNAAASSTSMAELYGQPPVQYPGARAKRLRMADSVEDLGAGIAGGGGSGSGDTDLYAQSPARYYHSQQQQQQSRAMLPPIQTGGMARGAQGDPRSLIARPRGQSAGVQLIRPDVVPTAGTVRMPRDVQSQGEAGMLASGSRGHPGGTAASGPGRGGNPDAQPTQTWLSGQRQYKNALLRLLTLDSFYPSDVAMLNMFRSQGDFTSEQVEANGAALMSWARSWLRYNRNAVLKGTLETKAKATLPQLAETLQHDLNATVDFTKPENLRRCALLRLIYYQWQAENKLGTKSQSLYRDYEARLREIEAMPTPEEQEQEWGAIMEEENSRRLSLIREGRGSGGMALLPRPSRTMQPMSLSPPQNRQLPPPALALGQQALSMQQPLQQGQHGSGQATPVTPRSQPTRRQSEDWPPYPMMGSPPSSGQAHYHQQAFQQHQHQQHQQQQRYRDAMRQHELAAGPQGHYGQQHLRAHPQQSPPPPPPPMHPYRFSHPTQLFSPQPPDSAISFQQSADRYRAADPGPMRADPSWQSSGNIEGAQVTGKDDGSEISVKMSPEP
ncbi:hypothetical protein GGF46_005023 [Coemansia sp. RSA 552]|nr:hypothetical protein GGF46_005023 [Coemansia sp. RSA 552]